MREGYLRRLIVSSWSVVFIGLALHPAACDSGDSGSGEQPCGEVTFEGVCDGDSLKWCDDGILSTQTCTKDDQVCRPTAFNGNFCVDDGVITLSQVSCDDAELEVSRCEGDLAVWCQDGFRATQDCAAQDKVCRPLDTEPGVFCTVPCGALTMGGLCDGSLLTWCKAGSIHEFDCGKTASIIGVESSCEWIPDSCVHNCVGCGDIPEEGRCDGEVFHYCDDGIPLWDNCEAIGKTCGEETATGRLGYIPAMDVSCEPEVYLDQCDENGRLTWCNQDGSVGWINCMALGLTCEVALDAQTDGPAHGGAGRCLGCDVSWWDDGCYYGWRRTCGDDHLVFEACQECD